jgi:hypothetical protein
MTTKTNVIAKKPMMMNAADQLREYGLRLSYGHIAICGASMTGKTTILLKLLRRVHEMFDYKIDKVLLFYEHSSPMYDQMAEICRSKNIEFEHKRYDETPLDMSNLEAARGGTSSNITLCIFDDATQLVQSSPKFNQMIHVARHSRFAFILLVHGIVYTRPQARTMVSATAAAVAPLSLSLSLSLSLPLSHHDTT